MASETRDVTGFDRVTLKGVGQIKLAQAEAWSLRIEADEQVLPQISAVVEGTTLMIRYEVSWSLLNVGFLRPIEFHITCPALAALSIEGAGTAIGGGLTLGDLEVTLAGSGKISLGMHATAVKATIAGAGGMAFAGRADALEARVSGAGEFDGAAFEVGTATVEINGAGAAVVRVRDELDARISGAGSVRYHGNPTVRQQLAGAGSIKQADG